jgi:hypothetical protein
MSSKVHPAFRVISLSLFLSFGLNVASQTAHLSGAVRDSSQALVVGATVSISSESTGLKQTSSSNQQGFYFFAFVRPGSYTITARAPGFGIVTRKDIQLDPGQEARLDLILEPATVKEDITVHARSSSLQTESSAVGTEIDPQLVQNLPLNGRTFQSLIALAPGVVWSGTLNPLAPQAGIFVNGQRDTSNYFTVDGVSANVGIGNSPFFVGAAAGGTLPAATVLGTTHNLVTIDGMQEFKMQTSTYSAENGRSTGGQVQIVTRSGSNDPHGEFFDYFRNQVLDKRLVRQFGGCAPATPSVQRFRRSRRRSHRQKPNFLLRFLRGAADAATGRREGIGTFPERAPSRHRCYPATAECISSTERSGKSGVNAGYLYRYSIESRIFGQHQYPRRSGGQPEAGPVRPLL